MTSIDQQPVSSLSNRSTNPQTQMVPSSKSGPPGTTIHDLPYDILSEILRDACQGPSSRLSRPAELGAVCVYWRETVWSTPRLWTSFIMNASFWKRADRTGILQLYFRNAGNQKLDITLASPPHDYKGHTGNSRGILGEDVFETIFINNPNRLKSLTFLQFPASWYPYIEDVSKTSCLSSLQSLNIRDLRFGQRVDGLLSQFTAYYAPQLTTLSLHGPKTLFTFPWSQLLHLKLAEMPSMETLQIALQCSNLISLQIENPTETYASRLPSKPVTLSNLKTFSLICDEIVPRCWDECLGRGLLEFPSLSHLTLNADPALFDHCYDFVRNHVPRSLTHLAVRYTHTPEFTSVLRELLPRLDSLTSLHLAFLFMDVPEDAIQLLCITGEEIPGTVISPNLVELCLSANSDSDIFGSGGEVFSAIVEMARSRSMARKDRNMGLRKLGLYFDRSVLNSSLGRWSEYIGEGLRGLAGEGLEVDVRTNEVNYSGEA